MDDATTVAAIVADHLEGEGVDYSIGGALALAAYGMQRMTRDADLGVYVTPAEMPHLYDAVERAGCLFERARADADVARASFFTARRGHVLIDIFVAFHSHHAEARARRRRIRMFDGRERWFLSPEDLAIHKLAMLRPKDIMDLEYLFAAQGQGLDLDYIRRWTHAVAPDPGDRRRAVLDELAARFYTSRNEK